MVECYFMSQSDSGLITETHALRRWSNLYMRAMEGLKDPRMPLRMETMLKAEGLEEVEVKMIPLPLCGWPTGELGRERLILHGS